MNCSKYLLSFIFFLSLGAGTVTGQVQQIVHQTFPVGDTVDAIQLDLYGTYGVESWPGNTILVETQVKIFNAAKNILDHLLEAGRYELEVTEGSGTLLHLVSKDTERRPIRTSKGECFEEVEQLLYLPEEFIQQGENLWRRPGGSSSPVDSSGSGEVVQPPKDTIKQGSSSND